MEQQEKGNVILLPKTVDYYQMQLTRLLESEQYGEAMDLLRFLLDCRPDDRRTVKEWEMLLAWMESQFPVTGEAERSNLEEQEEQDEAGMLQEHIASRAVQDEKYGRKLLDMLVTSDSLEKQLMALDQLAFVPDPAFDKPMIQWIKRRSLHPLVQFKGLQTLKARGVLKVQIVKEGKTVKIDLESVPSSFEDQPRLIQFILYRVQEVCEVQAPGLSYFAEQVWKEYLAFTFGTQAYDGLLMLEEEEVPLWAAALHIVASEFMGGEESNEEIMVHYGLIEEDEKRWELLARSIRSAFGGGIGN